MIKLPGGMAQVKQWQWQLQRSDDSSPSSPWVDSSETTTTFLWHYRANVMPPCLFLLTPPSFPLSELWLNGNPQNAVGGAESHKLANGVHNADTG